ncbi:MAG: glycosyltransferase family 2 protein [Candidatus Bathyarchaeota archaeon]|nr:glycosyltransferase family 2 protein [Candidatus Bathyarchaeum sp.]
MNDSQFGNNRVTVIIPTLNEEKNIYDIINSLKQIGCADILVVDGHSKDKTVEIAKTLGAKVILQNGSGKGGALREAFQESMRTSDITVMLDADGSMDPKEIFRFAEAVELGADVVKGSRFLPCGGSEDLTPLRRVGNRILTGISNFMFLTNYSDLCYGYMAFKKDALRCLNPVLESENFEIETEICIKSKLLGLTVHEIPSIERARRYGISNLNTFRDGFSILKTLFRGAMNI